MIKLTNPCSELDLGSSYLSGDSMLPQVRTIGWDFTQERPRRILAELDLVGFAFDMTNNLDDPAGLGIPALVICNRLALNAQALADLRKCLEDEARLRPKQSTR